MEINPFGETKVEDYSKLFKEFGIENFKDIVPKLKNPLAIMRRGILFGHRDFNLILECIKNKKKFAVMSGIKPSNYLHLGSKMVVDEIVYFQNLGAKVYYALADIETLVDNKLDLKTSFEFARDNVIDLLALGIDEKNAKIYLQSREIEVLRKAFVYSNNVTNNMLNAVYGERPIGLYMAALTQMADILLPQIENGKIPTVVPVGIDQDPHIRLVRDIANKQGLIPPASTYHKFMGSLTGEPKMSKRKPEGVIFLRESPEIARKKIMSAFTGGRDTLEEQKKLGGRPDICKIFELYSYIAVEDDKELKGIRIECENGKIMCGPCKKRCADMICKFLEEHQKKRKEAEKKVDKILK